MQAESTRTSVVQRVELFRTVEGRSMAIGGNGQGDIANVETDSGVHKSSFVLLHF